MAEGVGDRMLPERVADAAEPAVPEPETREPIVTPVVSPEERRLFRVRFGLAYLVLAVIAGAAVGAAILLVDREPAQKEAWSSWQPVGRESSYDNQIADYVSGRYKLPSGKTLVGVIPSSPQVQTAEGVLPLQAVAIQNDPRGDTEDISIVATDNSVMYTLCGLGPRCSIREGTPSVERMLLLRREALELALYSFKYIDGLTSVIALMPTNIGDPRNPSDDTATALFFQRSDRDVRRALDEPLERTLLSPNPPQAAEINATEGLIIDRLTESRLFRYQFTQTQAGGAVIVLVPVDTT